MAEKKAKRPHDDLHNPKKYATNLEEWTQYHGIGIHPVTGEEASFEEIRQFELGQVAQDTMGDLRKKVRNKETDAKTVHKEVRSIAEKAYLASIGIKEKDKKNVSDLEERVDNFLVSVANNAVGRNEFANAEQVIESIVSAKNPFYGNPQDGTGSPVLQALVSSYAQNSYESKTLKVRVDGEEKGQSARRLNYLTGYLDHKEHRENLATKFQPLLQKYGYHKDAGFHPVAEAGDILSEASSLMNYEAVTSTKAPHLKNVKAGRRYRTNR